MNLKSFLILGVVVFSAACSNKSDDKNSLDNFDPSSPNAEEELRKMDKAYQEETGESPFLKDAGQSGTCYQLECPVFAHVSKQEQVLRLYVNGKLHAEWDVSTGVGGHATPNFDKNPNGRVYKQYTSKTYPGGGYIKTHPDGTRENLGNMPWAVFIEGGYAIHGTGTSNWSKLGKPASHGCVRLHPDNAEIFNRLVRQAGVKRVWITIE